MQREILRYFGLVILVLITATTGANAQSRTRVMASTGASAPGGGTFAPSINRAVEKGLPSICRNNIVFGSDVQVDGQSVYGVFVVNAGVLRLVTRIGLPVPGGTVRDIRYFTVDRLGNVFISVVTGAGPNPDVILKYTSGTLVRVVGVGDALPVGQTATVLGPVVAADGLGGVYFQAQHAGGYAIVDWQPGPSFVTVAATGQSAPGGGTFGALSPATIAASTSGLVVFAATVDNGPDGGGIFSGLPGNLIRVNEFKDALSNITVSDNDDIDVAFMLAGSPAISQTTLTGTIQAVANNATAPRTVGGRFNFGSFNVGLATDDEASLYFFAPVAGDPSRGAGLFRRDRFTSAITAVTLQGDPAAESVSGLFGLFAIVANFPARIANDDGDVVFMASAGSSNNVTGIFTTLGAPQGLVPNVLGVQVKGNKLIVTGNNFEAGAKIRINGNIVNDSKNNKKAPSTKLQSKTAGTSIAAGSTVSITVINTSGAISAPFSFTR